jgi:hypothetical protein
MPPALGGLLIALPLQRTAALARVTTADIGMGRIALFTFLPQCAGLVLMLAMGLWAMPRLKLAL